MKRLIIYGSQYGTTKRYAQKFSEMTGIPSLSYEAANDLTDCRLLVYFGGLYAGGLKGFRHIVKLLPEDMKLILVTVGLADVNDQENINNIRNSLKTQVPETLLSNAQIFHLRGGIDYKKLSFKHRTMMTLLYHKVKNLPEEKKTAEDRAMIETFNSKVDFVNYHSLDQIIEAIR